LPGVEFPAFVILLVIAEMGAAGVYAAWFLWLAVGQ
jgi:hypothetical protein